MNQNKDIMVSLRLSPRQYLSLLESLIKEKKSKSDFIRESISEKISKITPQNCRKKDVQQIITSLYTG